MANKEMVYLSDVRRTLLRFEPEAVYILNGIRKVDAVEVVRCRDCKHRGEDGCPMYHEEYIEWDDDGYLELDIVEHDRTTDDGFCDRGERGTNV